MSEHTIIVLATFLYNFSLVAGTTYMVAIYEWSPWWFLLTVACMVNVVKTKDKD